MASSARSLAVCRVLTAATLLYESTFGLDSHSARAFVSDAGLWTRIDQMETNSVNGRPSLLLASGDERWISLLLSFLFMCGVALAYGWRTRQVCALAFVIWSSILDRCWLMVHSFDDLTAVLLLWGALGLPWAETWAVDALLRPESSEQHQNGASSKPRAHTQRLARLGLWVSTGTVYFLAGWHKSDVTWADGSAVLITMDTTHLRRPLGQFVCESTVGATLMTLICPTVRPFELLAPLLLVVPTASEVGWRMRAIAIAALLSMHLAIGLTLRLNAIGLINAAALAAFLPDQLWDALRQSRLSPARTLAAVGLQTAAAAIGPKAAAAALVHAGLDADAARSSTTLHPPGAARARGADQPSGRRSVAQHTEDASSAALPPLARDAIDLGAWVIRAALVASRAFVLLFLLLFTVGGEVLPSTPLWAWGTSVAAHHHLDTPNASWHAHWLHAGRDRLRDGGRFLRLEQRYHVFSPRPPAETHWILLPGMLRGGLQVDLMPALRGRVQAPFEPLPSHMLKNLSATPPTKGAAVALRAPRATFDARREPPPRYATDTVYSDRWAKYFEVMVQVRETCSANAPRRAVSCPPPWTPNAMILFTLPFPTALAFACLSRCTGLG